jgi:crotonobetainyl-CoA:carnitine CoA-transferase CaiB-like acyl-CoA transferase
VAAVLERLERGGIANAAVNDVAAVAGHPQLAARERWTRLDSFAGPLPALLPPHTLADAPPSMGRVPALGEHTAAVLAELARGENHRPAP